VASIFDCCGNFTLVFGTGAGLATWSDLSRFINETGHQLNVFIVDLKAFVTAELTKLGAGYKAAIAIATANLEIATVGAFGTFGRFIFCHFITPD
jgi:hypothetical protein